MIENIKIVRFNNLKNFHLWDDNKYTFDSISYGDAVMTLVSVLNIVYEIENHDDDELAPLLAEVSSLPEDVLIALNG